MNEILEIILTIIGTVITITSFIFGFYERTKREDTKNKRISQLWSSINRAKYAILNNKVINDFTDEKDKKNKLWLSHQAACDLYISLVEQYLSEQKKFSYIDLENLCKNKIISTEWQEKQWRILICHRKENRDIIPPPYFISKK